jgi:hypothetical protein
MLEGCEPLLLMSISEFLHVDPFASPRADNVHAQLCDSAPIAFCQFTAAGCTSTHANLLIADL